MLTDPKDSNINFELIIPSLPGYGFSERAHKTDLAPTQMGQIFLKLMKRLGHEKFYVQGGDWGSAIAAAMSALYPKNVQGAHMNMCLSMHPRSYIRTFLASIYPTLFMDEDEAKSLYPLSKYYSNLLEESGYMHIQATKPDTVGVALSNSPTGLAAYILEKFSSWTNGEWKTKNNGGLIPYYELDDLLDNVMVYWVTNSITSSVRLYAEAFAKNHRDLKIDSVPIQIPTGCMASPKELFGGQPPWILQDKIHQLVHYTKAEKGGHFSAFEVPEILSKDVLKFFNHLETKKLVNFNKK
jgi:juvenile hormone epoxide hydrolase